MFYIHLIILRFLTLVPNLLFCICENKNSLSCVWYALKGTILFYFHELIFSQSFGRLGMTYPSVLTITCDRFPVCFNDKQINLSCGLLYWFISWINFCIRLVGWYDQLPFVLHRLLVSLTHFSSAILYCNVVCALFWNLFQNNPFNGC